MHNLNSLSVLVTRPLPRALGLAKQIHDCNGSAFLFPSFYIKSLPISTINTIEAEPDIIIFTSANAVHCAFQQGCPLKKNAAYIAVGPTTKNTLAQFKIDSTVPENFSSEGILALPITQAVQQKTIWLITGKEARRHLYNTLIHRGANVDHIICYERIQAEPQPHTIDQVSQLQFDVIVSTSKSSLFHLNAILEQHDLSHLKKTPLMVAHPRQATYAKSLGFTDIIEAKNSLDASLIQQLDHLSKLLILQQNRGL